MTNLKLVPFKPQLIKTVTIETYIGQYEDISFYLASSKLSSEIGHHIHNLDSEDLVEYQVRNAVESTLRDSCGQGGCIYIHGLPAEWRPLLNEVLNEMEDESL